jgi:aminomethyltransferase
LGDIDLTDSATGSATDAEILKTPLHALHLELGGRMVPFAGYDMPVQYPLGIMKEHLHTRIGAGLFDVSHMGQVILRPKSGDVADAALALERLVPVNILGLAEGRQRYALFTSEQGGILDDLMVTNRGDHLFLVVNAACKDADEAHMRAHLSDACEIERLDDRALMALQGPQAGAVLAAMDPASADMRFMDVRNLTLAGADCIVSRSGYSGEDGFEISVPNADAETLARALIAHDAVGPIGLGARDSLRLEAGLCLYGSDLDTTTSPVEASLIWAMQKVRRTGGDRAGGFPGAERILGELLNGASRKRVGLLPEGRAPVRGGAPLFAAEGDAEPVGTVTSGAFGPSLGGPMAMGYVPAALAAIGTRLFAEVRGKKLPVTVATMPFVTPNYKRG